MAPSVVASNVPISFDGKAKAKTSGQLEPEYSLLAPYKEFPNKIDGPTVWKAEDYRDNPERWTHQWSNEELEEIEVAADRFLSGGYELTDITKVRFPSIAFGVVIANSLIFKELFPLSKLTSFLDSVRYELINGKGFILFRGFPVERWGNKKSAVAYMGVGTYLGYFVSQNGKGHVLGHVKDLGEDSTQIDKVRIYRTNAR